MNTHERPTPETDAFFVDLYTANTPLEMVELASGAEKRKMQQFERERDEARGRIAELEKQLAELQKPKEQNTFEAHGLIWIRHVPGDPMPCDGKTEVRVLYDCEKTGGYWHAPDRARFWNWADEIRPNNRIIGWNYADAP